MSQEQQNHKENTGRYFFLKEAEDYFRTFKIF